jgi:integrase/recombinase XerD
VRKALHGRVYVSSEHHGCHESELFFDQAFGRFRPVVEEYFTNFAQMHYRDLKSVRSSLGRFFRFLNEIECKSLDEVTCDTVTGFLVWSHKNNIGVRSDLLSCITTFFKWLQSTGKRSAGNPVNSFLHRKKKEKRLPRPLSAEELKNAHQWLDERGDARLRLAFAIGEESGLRIGEICRLRVQDVSSEGQRLFVRLPNKTSRERYAFFCDKTATCLREWLAERDASCTHDHLLYNYSKRQSPFTPGVLGEALSRVLCKSYGGKVLHEQGFDKWSTHRLRHTMATKLAEGGADVAVLMSNGGWSNRDTMSGYVKVNQGQVKRGYEEAMRRAECQEREAPRTRVLTPQEVLQIRRGVPPRGQNSPDKHCV